MEERVAFDSRERVAGVDKAIGSEYAPRHAVPGLGKRNAMQALHRTFVRGASMLLLALLGACSAIRATGNLPPDTTLAEARQSFGGAEYPLADGGTRLEVRQARATQMLDFDASGRYVGTQQVLTPQTFATITPGMSRQEVLTRIGRPTFVFPVGWQKLQVWNYRFGGIEGDCVVFQVSISNATQTVTDAGPNTDPACDHGPDRS